MKEFLAREIHFLLWSIGSGCLLGAAYWMILIFRRLVPHHKIIAGLEDIMYWLCAAVLMFAVILVANDGAVRWFAVAAMAVGMVIISVMLKYLEKGITIIYNRFRKARVTDGKKHKA